MMLNTNPTVDIREMFDDLYQVKAAEWQGFYPSDLQGQIEPVSDEYKDLVYEVCKRRKDILRLAGKEPMWEVEVDEEAYREAQMEMSNNLLKVRIDMQNELLDKQ